VERFPDENNVYAIETHDLTKKFGERIAVNDLNIEIRRGEIFSLLGRNGAGKTTTIKMLCCLLKPSSGYATVMNFSIKKNPFKIKEIIGVSPQEIAIAEHLDTWENLLLMGGVFNLGKDESKKRATKLMDLMELENRKDQTRKLSGGMQRRLSIAMALMSDPRILFLDEPTLGLDPHARKNVWNYIEKLKGDKTILLTTHYLEEADSLADHIAIIDTGKIIEKGTLSELKKKYTSSRTLKVSSENISSEIIEGLEKKGIAAHRTTSGLEITAKEFDFYGIIDFLHSKNIRIHGIEMHESTLDDVFLQLTGKEDS
jgi:ABC-2 type transport system ATP-binding protein